MIRSNGTSSKSARCTWPGVVSEDMSLNADRMCVSLHLENRVEPENELPWLPKEDETGQLSLKISKLRNARLACSSNFL